MFDILNIHKLLEFYTCSLILLFLSVQSVAATSSASKELLYKDHQFVNKIWDVKNKHFIDEKELINTLSISEYVLLGERHDNIEHHNKQAWVIGQLDKNKVNASVSFEMIDNYQGKRIKKQKIETSDELIASLNESKTNWNYEELYKGVFDSTLEANYPIEAANLNRQRLMHSVKQGEHHYPSDIQILLRQSPFDESMENSLFNEIKQYHCDMLDDAMARKMIDAQRLRDAIMALSVLNSDRDLKVLIAGAGHARTDRGVPMYIKNNDKNARVVSLGFIEVSAGLEKIDAYNERWGTKQLPFDYVWFTPQVQREDACEKIKKHFKKSKKPG